MNRTVTIPQPCPLCASAETMLHARAHERDYFACPSCGLVFMDRAARLGAVEEKARYETHENDPADDGYRAFLSVLLEPLVRQLSPAACGLDYGSGPGPTLSVMLEERGFEMEIYDPFFASDRAPLDRIYDFVTCTETAEHFFDPGSEFRRLGSLLRRGGWLGVMTQFVGEHDFTSWRYARDATHVCFYRKRTMEWIAANYGWGLRLPRPNVALFQKGRPAADET